MKNIQNRINAQLFKQKTVELQSEKVELALIDDAERVNKALQDIFSRELKLRSEALQLSKKINALDSEYSKEEKKARDIVSKFSKAAKELGISEPRVIFDLTESVGLNPKDMILKQIK